MTGKTLGLRLGWVSFALGVAAAAGAGVGRLAVEIQQPASDRILTGAETSIEVQGGASVFGGVKQLDLFFVMDTSSSLKLTDPRDYRSAGAIGLVESLPEWSDVQIGVVAFDRKAELLSPLSADRVAVVNALRQLDYGSTTNIADGIHAALTGFEGDAREGSTRVILIFTDGRSNEKKARRAMQAAAAQGVVIHTLLLGGDKLGEVMLRGIAEGTGGSFIQVTDPARLPEAFLGLRTTGVESVTLRVNDSPPIPAALSMGSFAAQVPLERGPNRIVATVKGRDGRTQSDSVTVTLRPQGCAELAIRAEREGEPALSISDRSVEIVIDASRSMWGQLGGVAKMAIAKETLEDALDWLPSDLTLSLRAYGHQHAPAARDCKDTQLLVPAGSDNRDDIRQALAALRPKGQTPLGYAVEQLGRDLENLSGERAVVLVTDGIESCGGDAPAAARDLQRLGRIPVHVIGFGMGNAEDEDLASLRAISDASGGRFLTAGSAQELKAALSTAVGTSFRLQRGDTVVGEGNLGANEVLRVPAGEYSLQLDSAPPRELVLTLESEVKHTVVFSRDKQGVSHSEQRDEAEYSMCEQPALPAKADPSGAEASDGPKARRTLMFEVESGRVEVWQNLRPDRSADWGVMVRHPSVENGRAMIYSGDDPAMAEQAARDARDTLLQQGSLNRPTPR